MPIPGYLIASYIEPIINDYRINMFLFLAHDTLENMESQVMEFIKKYKFSKVYFDENVEIIFEKKYKNILKKMIILLLVMYKNFYLIIRHYQIKDYMIL